MSALRRDLRNSETTGHGVMRPCASIRPMRPTGGIGGGGWVTARYRSAVVAALAALALVGLLYLELAFWDISSGPFSVEGPRPEPGPPAATPPRPRPLPVTPLP